MEERLLGEWLSGNSLTQDGALSTIQLILLATLLDLQEAGLQGYASTLSLSRGNLVISYISQDYLLTYSNTCSYDPISWRMSATLQALISSKSNPLKQNLTHILPSSTWFNNILYMNHAKSWTVSFMWTMLRAHHWLVPTSSSLFLLDLPCVQLRKVTGNLGLYPSSLTKWPYMSQSYR